MDPSHFKEAFSADGALTDRRDEPNPEQIHLPAELLREMIAYFSTRQLYTLALLSRTVFTYALQEVPQRLKAMKDKQKKDLINEYQNEVDEMLKRHRNEAEEMRQRHQKQDEEMRKKLRDLFDKFDSL